MIQRISIHALLAESDQTVTKWASSAKISIHALLAESDKSSWSLTRLNRNISIHALLAESDGLGFCYHCDDVAFLSTLSLRRATAPNRRPCRCNKISIHALLAESDLFFIVFDLFRNISIHALLAESDSPLSINCMIHMQFLSTLSLRRATMQIVIIVVDTVISIHALLAESDFMFSVVFYLENIFLSTLSLRRATTCGGGWNEQPRYFYPRSPCGERLTSVVSSTGTMGISIHALLAESDRFRIFAYGRRITRISIHALLAESDSKSAQNSGALLRIWNKFYGDCIFMLTGKAVFYPFCPCFFHIFWCEGTGNFMIAFPSH